MDLIKIALGDYPRYEELLLRKDKFEKEALQWYEDYIREFGPYLIALFEVKVECIRLKKLIAMAQTEINQGFSPDMEKINSRVEEQMQSYYEELKQKYSKMDFVLVSKDKKDQARLMASSFANPHKTVVLIDEEKIEKLF